MKDFFENPELLIGLPILLVGLVGMLIPVIAFMLPEPKLEGAEAPVARATLMTRSTSRFSSRSP